MSVFEVGKIVSSGTIRRPDDCAQLTLGLRRSHRSRAGGYRGATTASQAIDAQQRTATTAPPNGQEPIEGIRGARIMKATTRTKQGSAEARRRSGTPQRLAFDSDKAATFQIAVLSNLFARPFYESVGRHARININEWRLMLALDRHPALSQADIGYYTGLHKMTVSRAVRHLVTSGYVVAHDDDTDRRRKALFLTAKGESLCDEALPLLRRRETMVGAGLAPAELQKFKRTLAAIIANVRAWPEVF